MLVGAGLVPGLALAYVAGRSLRALLVGVTPATARPSRPSPASRC